MSKWQLETTTHGKKTMATKQNLPMAARTPGSSSTLRLPFPLRSNHVTLHLLLRPPPSFRDSPPSLPSNRREKGKKGKEHRQKDRWGEKRGRERRRKAKAEGGREEKVFPCEGQQLGAAPSVQLQGRPIHRFHVAPRPEMRF